MRNVKNWIFAGLLSAMFGVIAALPAAAQGTVPQQFINAQTGTTYAFLAQDCSKMVTFSNTSAVAVTLGQAGSSFFAGCFIDVLNKGNSLVTITPTTSTIDGAATKVLSRNEGVRIVNDGTNYFSQSLKTGIAAVGGGTFGSSTGAGTTTFSFGAAGPSLSNTTPSAWIRFTLTDGNVYFMPAWR